MIGFQWVPLSSTSPSVQHISSTQKGHSFSAPKNPQFHTKNPSVPHQKHLSSTIKTSQFNTLLRKKLCWTEGFLVWNRGSLGVELRGFCCGNEECVELRGFWCGTEGVLVLNWGFLMWNWGILVFNCGVLVLNWGNLSAEQVCSLCGTHVLNWEGLCGTEGYSISV